MTLAATYPANPQRLPDWTSPRLSFEKVENVVKPPQSPVARKICQQLPFAEYLAKTPETRPIIKHPARFTVNVPQGNPPPTCFINAETKYLRAPPAKLPEPAINISLSIIKTIVYLSKCNKKL
ncbi:MAG: hypothetical protein NC335_12720 [Bacteroides sp.]|nr:hypothetical protein [Bacteroides sp.]